jgi:replication initiation protein RepC
VAIVSAKPAGHFRTSPGGYSHGMVAKAKAGGAEPGADDLGLARGRPTGRGGHIPRAGWPS